MNFLISKALLRSLPNNHPTQTTKRPQANCSGCCFIFFVSFNILDTIAKEYITRIYRERYRTFMEKLYSDHAIKVVKTRRKKGTRGRNERGVTMMDDDLMHQATRGRNERGVTMMDDLMHHATTWKLWESARAPIAWRGSSLAQASPSTF